MAIEVDPYIRCDPPNLGIQTEVIICLTGAASTGANKAAWYAKHNFIITMVSVYSTDAPTGTSLIVDANKNGTTIFTDQLKRPQVAAGENSDDSDTPDVISIATGDRITFDIDQVGSGTPGGNPLMITLVLVKRG
jgi:hypothetical protein